MELKMVNCELCEKADQYVWRISDLEIKVAKMETLLMGGLVSSVGTLIGIIIIIVFK